jgi:diadenosine tetraphosphate (Ap4A) HIT family hydrolase
MATSCELCDGDGGHVVWRDAHWRVVRVADEDFPAFYRVICNAHTAEFSDLSGTQRAACMQRVAQVERVLRERLNPAKINLASLGNMVPHLHWHVIARFAWDSRFPQPIWAPALRVSEPAAQQRLPVALDTLDEAVARALSAPAE